MTSDEWNNVTTITATHPRKGHAACVIGDLMVRLTIVNISDFNWGLV
jgi:hypothetical protein